MELIMPKSALAIFFLICTFLLAAPAQVKSASSQTAAVSSLPLALKDGTAVHLRLTKTVSSADAHTGDPVELEVTADVKAAGRVVIAKGATAIGTVLMPESKKVKGQV